MAGADIGTGVQRKRWVWAIPGVAILLTGVGVLVYSLGLSSIPGFGGRGGGGGASLESCAKGPHQDPRDPTVALRDQEILDSKDMVFPPKFIWGTATSAYQIEGAVDEDGRGKSIWDVFSHTPHKVENNQNGDVACDHYHRYRDDVALMAALGIKHYRFSVAWPRIIPDGSGAVNVRGVQFYSDLVDELLKYNIEPYVTLYHWDLPAALEQKHDGWLKNDTVVPAFAKYADTLFAALGDRVKTWITFNEPWCTAVLGYGVGAHAPGKKLPQTGIYRAAHNQLLAHAAAVKVYRDKYQPTQKGRIGITLNSDYKQAACNSTTDAEAAQRAQIFTLAWFADPVFFGDYPKEMRETAGKRLPEFSEQQKADLKGSADFFALNHYTTALTAAGTFRTRGSYYSDMQTKDGKDPSWTHGESGWLNNVPWGFRKLLVWIKDRYNDPVILVTENGASEPKEGQLTDEQSLNDPWRQRYLGGYIAEMWKAVHFDKVRVAGYFYWSFYDNFEWADGYRPRFGLVRVNYTTQERTPKKSALMYARWIHKFSGGDDQGLPANATKLHPPLANLEVKAFKIKPTTIPPDPALLINDTTTTTTANKDKQEERHLVTQAVAPSDSRAITNTTAAASSNTTTNGPLDAGQALQQVGSHFMASGKPAEESAAAAAQPLGPIEGVTAAGAKKGGEAKNGTVARDAGQALQQVGSNFMASGKPAEEGAAAAAQPLGPIEGVTAAGTKRAGEAKNSTTVARDAGQALQQVGTNFMASGKPAEESAAAAAQPLGPIEGVTAAGAKKGGEAKNNTVARDAGQALQQVGSNFMASGKPAEEGAAAAAQPLGPIEGVTAAGAKKGGEAKNGTVARDAGQALQQVGSNFMASGKPAEEGAAAAAQPLGPIEGVTAAGAKKGGEAKNGTVARDAGQALQQVGSNFMASGTPAEENAGAAAQPLGPIEGVTAAGAKKGGEAKNSTTTVARDAGQALQQVGSNFMASGKPAEEATAAAQPLGPIEGVTAAGAKKEGEAKNSTTTVARDAGQALQQVGVGFMVGPQGEVLPEDKDQEEQHH